MKKNKQRFFYFLSPAVSLAHSDKKKKPNKTQNLASYQNKEVAVDFM